MSEAEFLSKIKLFNVNTISIISVSTYTYPLRINNGFFKVRLYDKLKQTSTF